MTPAINLAGGGKKEDGGVERREMQIEAEPTERGTLSILAG